MNIKKIDKETDNGAFELAFREGNWGINKHQVLPMFKAFIKRHNEMVEALSESQRNTIRKRKDLLEFLDWHYEDDIADREHKETIVDMYLSKKTDK